jgi:hypothetical protein
VDWLTEGGAVVGLFVLRCGLPLAILLAIGYFLRRLDDKWQAEQLARRQTRMVAPRCWEIKGCNPAAHAACAACRLRPLPCWMAWRKIEGRVPERCFTCLVFLNA